MEGLSLLSGVVRNRKVRSSSYPPERSVDGDSESSSLLGENRGPPSLFERVCGNLFLRSHQFTFDKTLAMHISLCMMSLAPFMMSGDYRFAAIPLSLWLFYNGTSHIHKLNYN